MLWAKRAPRAGWKRPALLANIHLPIDEASATIRKRDSQNRIVVDAMKTYQYQPRKNVNDAELIVALKVRTSRHTEICLSSTGTQQHDCQKETIPKGRRAGAVARLYPDAMDDGGLCSPAMLSANAIEAVFDCLVRNGSYSVIGDIQARCLVPHDIRCIDIPRVYGSYGRRADGSSSRRSYAHESRRCRCLAGVDFQTISKRRTLRSSWPRHRPESNHHNRKARRRPDNRKLAA